MLSFPGPPFTHQQTPRKMVYYGQTSCEQDTERYIDVVKYVFSSYRKEVPLVINTMGWVKGKQRTHSGGVVQREPNNLAVYRLALRSRERGNRAHSTQAVVGLL